VPERGCLLCWRAIDPEASRLLDDGEAMHLACARALMTEAFGEIAPPAAWVSWPAATPGAAALPELPAAESPPPAPAPRRASPGAPAWPRLRPAVATLGSRRRRVAFPDPFEVIAVAITRRFGAGGPTGRPDPCRLINAGIRWQGRDGWRW